MSVVTEWLRLRPEPGYGIDPAIATPAEGDGAVTRILEAVEGTLGQVPALVWIVLLLISGATTVITLPVARRRARLAGARSAGHTDTQPGDQALFLAAMIPAALFLTAVLAGSFRGLAAFGRDELRWTDGWEYLVPGTLDGVALSFGFLAFRAVRKQQSPDRANRLVWSAALASAVINFAHEARLPYGSWLGGLYLALMSVFGMLIFHEFLAQFEEGAEAVHRKNPKYGLRWITWPSNTVCAWVAWHNYPPAEGTPATVAASVAHLEHVRAEKRARRAVEAAERTSAPWWAPIVPWAWIARLAALAEAQQVEADKQRAELTARASAAQAGVEQIREVHRTEIEAVRSEAADTVEQLRAELAEQVARITAERDEAQVAEDRAVQAAEQARIEAAEQLQNLRATHAERIAELRQEQAERSSERPSSNGRAASRSTRSAPSTNSPKLTDEEAVAVMLRAHPEPGYEWGSREVHRLTSAGFGRVNKLIAMVAEHHANGGQRSTDDPEQEESRGDLVGATA